MRENLSAPGEFKQWFDGCLYALRKGDFTGIQADNRGRITADYGADRLAVSLYEKGAGRIYLSIESTSADVLNWFKTCVTNVMLHPQQGFREGLSQSAYNKRRQQVKRPATPQQASRQMADYEPTRAFSPYDEARQRHEEQTRMREQARNRAANPYGNAYDDTADYQDAYADEGYANQPYNDDTAVLEEEAPYDDAYTDAYNETSMTAEPQTFREKFDTLCRKKWFVVLMVFVLPPFGIYLIWRGHQPKSFLRILATAGALAYFLFIWLGFLGVNTGINRQTFTNLRSRQQQQSQSNVNKTPDSGSSSNDSSQTGSSDSSDDSGSSSTVLDQMLQNIQKNLSNMFGSSAQ